MLEEGAYSAYQFHGDISQGHRAEEYAREMTKAMKRVDRMFEQKYQEGSMLPSSFAVAKKNDENLTFKKNGSRRRALTGREAADADDLAARRRVRADAIDKERQEKHAEIMRTDKLPVSAFSQEMWPEENREPSLTNRSGRDELDDFDPLFPNDDGDSEIEYLGTQPTQNPRQSSSEGHTNSPSPPSSEPSLDNFANIDDFDDFPPLSPTSARAALPTPLMVWPDRASQQKALVIADDPDPSMKTRSKRHVKSASTFKAARIESQKKLDEDIRRQRTLRRREEAARKQARKQAMLMKPRKEDVSQLADQLMSSSL